MRQAITALAVGLVAVSSVANAAESQMCLTANEFTALTTYGLPSVIEGVTSRCATTLPDNAWLKQNGRQLSVRYTQGKQRAWPGAKAAFLKLGGTQNASAVDTLRSLPDSTLQPMADGLIQGMVAQQLPLERCATVDRAIRLLSPLPADSTAELIALAAGIGAQSGRAKAGKFSICPA